MAHKILVVDDSSIARKMLIRSLPAHWDVDIQQASNGLEALEIYRQGDVQLMFLDLTMPEMDGYQLLEALQPAGPQCPIIVCSADIQPLAQEKVLALGALAFIKKPVDMAKIEQILKERELAL